MGGGEDEKGRVEAGKPVRKLLQYRRQEAMEVSTRVTVVKGSGRILKAEPTGYDVRYKTKREVKDYIMAFGAKKKNGKMNMLLTEMGETEGRAMWGLGKIRSLE